MDDKKREDLVAKFKAEIVSICSEYEKVAKTPPSPLRGMIKRHGVVEAVKRAICGELSGFTDALLAGHKELTAEYVVAHTSDYHKLFDKYPEDVVGMAKRAVGLE